MRQRLRSQLTFANVVSAIALFVALGGTATAAVIITDNSQVAQDTISGHKPPTGDHSNVIKGSVNATDLADKAVPARKLNIPASFTSAGLPDALGDCGSINGWVNWSPDVNQTVGYYRGPDGIVHLEGTTRLCGASADPILNLPLGYRPERRDYELAARLQAPQDPDMITIFEKDALGSSAGDVVGQDSDVHSLDGISFRCGPSGVSGCP